MSNNRLNRVNFTYQVSVYAYLMVWLALLLYVSLNIFMFVYFLAVLMKFNRRRPVQHTSLIRTHSEARKKDQTLLQYVCWLLFTLQILT